MTDPTLLDEVLAPGGITTCVQPIVQFRETGFRVDAVECLSRGPGHTNGRRAEVLFEYVRRRHAEMRVDRACLQAALRAVQTLPAELDIAVNVHAATLANDAGFSDFVLAACAETGIDARRLTLEITEHAGTADRRRLFSALDSLRACGVRFALDDLGAGTSNYAMILEARPEILKIDRFIVHGCARDRRRLAMIRNICDLATQLDATLVAEGVEEPDDRDALLAAGIFRMQGYLFGRPFDPRSWPMAQASGA